MITLTPEMKAKYRPELSWNKNAGLFEINRVFAKAADNLYKVRRNCFMRLATDGAGIGDIVIPKSGDLVGIPFQCSGFTCQYIEPVFGLPAGKCSALILSALYPDGQSTGLRFYVPTAEVWGTNERS